MKANVSLCIPREIRYENFLRQLAIHSINMCKGNIKFGDPYKHFPSPAVMRFGSGLDVRYRCYNTYPSYTMRDQQFVQRIKLSLEVKSDFTYFITLKITRAYQGTSLQGG
jgi:hypothetical protein